MNGEQKYDATQETRPPAVGQEVSNFRESFQPCLESCASSSKNRMEQKECSERECNINYNDAKDTSDKLPLASSETIAPEQSMEHSPSNSSPPPPYKWAQSLLCLLDDMQGVELFQRFLLQEGQDTKCLDFLFACRGVKKVDPTDIEYLQRLVRAVYEKKAKRMNAITEETKLEIKRKISACDIDVNIFDEAQHQVETDIINTTYPNFLQSDLYLQHLRTFSEQLTEKDYSAFPKESECLPTLHEDSELHLSEKYPGFRKESLKHKLPRAYPNPYLKLKEAGAYLKSPYSTTYGSFHAKYGSFLPTSAQDSELQSLSSEAMTDDAMSQANSSFDYSASKSKEKRSLKNRHVYLNKDTLITEEEFIPRTQRHDVALNKSVDVKDFYDLLCKKLNKLVEEQNAEERLDQSLKNTEGSDCTRHEAIGLSNMKTNKHNDTVFDTTFFFGQSEENDQAILDRHVSRVFDSLTPGLSPGYISPPITRVSTESHPHSSLPNAQITQDLAYTNSHRPGLMSPFCVVPNVKPKREHDTRSNDSGAVIDWRSDDNLASRSQDHPFSRPNISRTRESLKRSGRRGCSANDSASSCVDSGISEVCEPVLPSHTKVTHWLESKAEKEWKNLPTSPEISLCQKGTYGNHFGAPNVNVQNFGALMSRTAGMPSQPLAQDLSMSAAQFPDTTTNLMEARRKLEAVKSRHTSGIVRNRQSFRASDVAEEGSSHRKQSKKSSAAIEHSTAASNNDVTVIGYSYGQGAVPYLTRFHGKNMTLKNFKSLLTKKGNFKYYFKKVENAFGTGTVLEEVSDDHAVLPLWEGKVFCVIETVEDVSSLED